MAKKTWTEKLNATIEPVVKPSPMNFAGMKEGQLMLIPTPKLVDTYIRAIDEGDERDVATLRSELAAQQGAEVACPVTTGIHLRTVAEAAFEQLDQGRSLSDITPVWRVISESTPTRKKVTFDPELLTQQRKKEGLEP